jgi:molybdopterin synthase catalytic subunit
MAFRITGTPIDAPSLMEGFREARAGAFAMFEGRVRDQNEGRPVQALEYEAYLPLAEKEGRRILEEAREKFDILAAECVHRTGSLRLGDVAVWVAVAAGHRGAAFEACRYIIDETKARLPIWKKEHYAGGASEWINCATRDGPGAAQGMK